MEFPLQAETACEWHPRGDISANACSGPWPPGEGGWQWQPC